MSALPERHMTAEEYLAWERASKTKHEYIRGDVIAFAGSTFAHAEIVQNLARLLYPLRRGQGCRTFTTEIRLRVGPATAYLYPDVMVICGEPEIADDQQDTVLNPTVIMEVLSRSTALIDRVKKFDLYTVIPSLHEYLLVAQDRTQIEQFVRQSDGKWLYAKVSASDTEIELPSLNAVLKLADVYENVTLTETDNDDVSDGLI